MKNATDPFEEIRKKERKVDRILSGRKQLEKLSQSEKDQLKNALWDLEKVTAEYIAYNEEKIERFKKSLVSLTEALKKLTTDETYKNQIVQDIIEAHQKNTGIIEEITESEKATLVKLQKHARKCRIEDLETDIKGYQNNITIAKGGLTMENSVNLHLKMY